MRMSVADVTERFSNDLNGLEEPVIVTRNGKSVAVLLPIEDDAQAERLAIAYSPTFRSILERGRQQIREGRGIPHDEFWRQLEAERAAN